jgi:hypothetical protein
MSDTSSMCMKCLVMDDAGTKECWAVENCTK